MSERHTHQAAALTNYSLAKRLEKAGGELVCWVPTLVFYAAVQTVDSRLADENLHLRSQGDRLAYVRVYSSDSTGSAGYKNLQTLSEEWRYDGRAPRDDQMKTAWRWAENIAAALGEPWPPR